MKSLIVFILFSLSLHENVFSMGSKIPKPIPNPANPTKEIKEEPAKGFNVAFSPIEKYSTKKEREIIKAAGIKIKEVVESKCFKDFIIKSKLEETNGKSNLDVYLHIAGMNGEIPVKMYLRRFTSAIAYRQPPETIINLNRNYFTEKVSICRWAATMAHEGLGHALGEYKHSFKWTVEREYSVPYKLGGSSDKYGGNAFSVCCK